MSLTSGQARNAAPWELTGPQLYNQRVDVHVSIISSSPREGSEVDLSLPTWSGQDCHSTLEKYFQVSVRGGSFILKCHLPIGDCFLYVQSLFGGSLTFELTGRDVGLMTPFFHCSGACPVLL